MQKYKNISEKSIPGSGKATTGNPVAINRIRFCELFENEDFDDAFGDLTSDPIQSKKVFINLFLEYLANKALHKNAAVGTDELELVYSINQLFDGCIDVLLNSNNEFIKKGGRS